LEKTFDLVLDNKGKTGCIQVVFNGIDSSNLRIPSILNGENRSTNENTSSQTNNQQAHGTTASNSNNTSNNATSNEEANPPAVTNQTQTTNVQLLQNLSAGLPSGYEYFIRLKSI